MRFRLARSLLLPLMLLLAIPLGIAERASGQARDPLCSDVEERIAELYATVDVCKASPAQIAELEGANAQLPGSTTFAQCSAIELVVAKLESTTPRIKKRRKLTPPLGALPPCTASSDSLRSLQRTGTQTAALAAGASYSSFIQGAIGEALSAPGITTSSSFPPPSGLGMGDVGPAPRRQAWRTWSRARATGRTGDDLAPGANVDWQHGTVAAGTDYLIAPGVVVGAFTGFEDFRYARSDILGRLTGDGPTIGAYFGAMIMPKVRLEVGVGHSWLDYSASANTASGSFDSSRWLFTGNLTGSYALGPLTLEPSAQLFWLRENQDAYTDSLGTLQESLGLSIGRASVGARLGYPMPLNGLLLTPYAGLYLDRYFGLEGGANTTVPEIGIADDLWSMRITGGVLLGGTDAWSVSIGGEAGNLGTGDGLIWSGQLSATIKFH